MIRKLVFLLPACIMILAAVLAYNTITAPNRQHKLDAVAAPELSDTALQHFQQAIRFKTISFGDASQWDSLPFLDFRAFLEKTYPTVHAKLTREIINGYSLLFTWTGKNTQLQPYILMAHQDVVPIEAGTDTIWTVDPFAGTIQDNYIWGRGTTDDKINLIGILESAEILLQQSYQPERTIYFFFGHDEEIGGKGAIAAAKLFKERNIKAALILDEGGIVTREKVPGLTKPAAMIATAEKGYMSLQLSVTKKGGHSSMPEKETAMDILNKALVKLHDNPFQPKIEKPTAGMLEFLGPEMPFPQNMAFANPWLFKKLIFANYEKSGAGNAIIRTTSVNTIYHAGIKDNVIPTLATAIINYRLLPSDASADIKKRVIELIGDKRVAVSQFGTNLSEGSPASDPNGHGFQAVDRAIRMSYDSIITSPVLLVGATDSRYFTEVSNDIIKFSPMTDPIGFHGIDERVSLESFRKTMWFFEQLMLQAK